MTDREERQRVIEILQKEKKTALHDNKWAFDYAIASIKTDLKYDLLYEETIGQADKQADKPTTKNGLAYNLCNSCTNIGCEFQSGIVRTKCAFYMPPHLEPDNCGNYVIQEPTTKNDKVDCKHTDCKNCVNHKYCDYEPTKNDLSVSSGLDKNSKKTRNVSPIIDWNNCHTSEQLDSIATTKNDLVVDCISRKAVQTRLKEIINEMETIFADIREREVNDSVCGLCEYDCDHGLDGFANECPGFEKDDCFKLNEKYKAEWLDISNLPSVTPQEPRWISCSEKLPEYGEEVLTRNNGGFIEIQSLESGCDVYWENQKGDWSDIDEVVAWMPLPKAYSEVEE